MNKLVETIKCILFIIYKFVRSEIRFVHSYYLNDGKDVLKLRKEAKRDWLKR
jgi:hypothetical protein